MSSKLIRWSGLASILGGLYALAFDLPHLIGAGLTLAGLVGLYAIQVKQTGRLGVVGITMTSIGASLLSGIEIARWIFPEWTIPIEMLLGVGAIFIFGVVLLGVATHYAGVLLSYIGIGLVVSALLILVIGTYFFGIYLAWLGYLMLTGKIMRSKQATPF